MAIFGRKSADARLIVSQSTEGRLGPDQVPAQLRVAAVTAPEVGPDADVAVISGLLLGPFPLEVVQLTVALAKESWPVAGQELAAVADPKNPLIFALVLGPAKPTGVEGPQDRRPDNSTWDPGPGGAHLSAAAEFLAETGFFADDFGPGLESRAPGLPALMNAASARHVTVIPRQTSIDLMSSGLPAQGVVVAARKLPMPAQMLPSPEACLAWLTLDVTPPQGDTYRSTIRWAFRSAQRFAALATPGTPLPLRIDPADRARVAIDSPALGSVPG